MNKRMKNKLAKQEALVAQEALAAAPVTARVQTELARGVSDAKHTVAHVIKEMKNEVVQRATEIEKRAEAFLEKVPLVGEAAAQKLGELSDKLHDKQQTTTQ